MGLRTSGLYLRCDRAAGGCVLAASLANWSSPDLLSWTIYLLLSVLASVVKLRLPGMDGTYSLGFLFVLYGVAHFSLPETLLAACAGAVAGSLLNTKKRSSTVQVLFNTANLVISVGACFLIARVCLASGMTRFLPAVIAMVACAYFIINTALVSGVLSLLQGKSLAEVCSQWYVWSFPYYLIGVALVGMLPSPGRAVPGEAWLVLLPLVLSGAFLPGLAGIACCFGDRRSTQPNAPMPRAARAFVTVVVASGAVLLVVAALDWHLRNPARFVTYLALAMIASTLKISIAAHARNAHSPSFVLVLAVMAGT